MANGMQTNILFAIIISYKERKDDDLNRIGNYCLAMGHQR